MLRAMRLSPLLLLVLLVPACSKDSPKPTSSSASDAGGSSSYVIEPDFKLPEGIDPNAPMVPLIDPQTAPPSSASAVASAAGDAAAAPATAAGAKGKDAGGAAAAAGQLPAATVKLVSNGAAPRKRLRYRFAAGHPETLSEELRTSIKAEGAGMPPQEQQTPPIRMVMAVNPTAVTPDGDCRYEYRVTTADIAGDTSQIPPEGLAQARQMFSGLVGYGGWAIVTSRGILKQTGDIQPPQGAGPETMQILQQFRQALKDVTPPLPEEEVGVGAKWTRTVVQPLGDGTSASEKETYTLTDLGDPQGKLDIIVEQTTPPQNLPPGPGGVTRRIESSGATGHGTTTFDLGRIMPPAETLDLTNVTVQSLSQGGQSERMKVTLTLGQRITGTVPGTQP
jgi:hypothetical protein